MRATDVWAVAALAFAGAMVPAAGCTLDRAGTVAQTCTSVAECVLPNACYVATCTPAGDCAFTPTDNSAVLAQTPNDCVRTECVIDGDSAEPVAVAANDDRPEDVACQSRFSCEDGELVEEVVGAGTTCGPNDQGQCQDGVCQVECTTDDDPVCDDANVCTRDLCNLTTNQCEHEALDNVDAPQQSPGDCRVVLCVLGNQTETYDDLDVFDDDSECTDDGCNAGQAVNTPLPLGSTCAGQDPLASVCNDNGSCVQCNADAECIGFMAGWDDTDCQTPRCVLGVCQLDCEPLGTVADVQSPLPDCNTTVCDGACAYVVQVDDTDIPSDGNDCTADECDNGVVMHPNEGVDTPCGAAGLCDGNGQCGACNDDGDCQADTFCRDYRCDTVQNPNVCVFANINEGADLPVQNDGDCRTVRCAAGLPANQIDDTDPPVDNLECTLDRCVGGVGSNPARMINTPCTEGGGRFCNGGNACVECNTVTQCSLGDGVCESDACIGNACMVVPDAVTVNAPPSCQSATPDCQVRRGRGVRCLGARR